LKIQNGGGRHLENHKNRDISATVCPIFTKFGTVPLKMNFKNPRMAARKPLNHHISAIFLTDFD